MDEFTKINELEKLRIIYDEILSGCSFSESHNLYIKHLVESENVQLIKKRREALLKFNKDGLPTKQERLNLLLADGQWTKEEEEKIEELKLLISDNEKNLKTIISEQKGGIEAILNQKRQELNLILRSKELLIGHTADEYAERESHNYLIYLSFYKDKELKERAFKDFSELDDMEYEELSLYLQSLEESFAEINEDNVKKISVLPMFINVFSYAKDNVYTFLNKPLCHLTTFQNLLISLGSRNINILSQADNEPPELIGDVKLNTLVDWYDLQYSIMLGKRGNKAQGVTKTIREVSK